MNALFIGPNKSGKSRLALEYTLKIAQTKPYFIATGIAVDEEMKKKIELHKKERKNSFITIEEPLFIYEKLQSIKEYKLLDCLSFWVSNMLLSNKENEIENTAHNISEIQNCVFVINEVGACVIPDNELARKFAHYNGIVAQIIAKKCDEVFLCSAGISIKIK
ncbi:MAG: bifunctional adenosylcobinamide kinase/adenosylcobinamide-phosphate guanylyltransferase [Desulfurella sp.]|uniref:bifunctional adenosylcobinamide kinase/adenosylcobinamide-phosphate guanylyltransferase n=1 Tax=Desulfurella sp. TaxID=1962857 RepID=UPI0003E0B6A9|nr:bifunctional adenosylcobinamide kinase/adenosylcobinamide-phosphate guanylyltransferase [Desulfurella sp.]AHF97047.1 adenosylcobinamide kinase [Desulfurella acetivorans A63]PMP87594.1 MAG: bifunctional adenosylcobinamide kinase/adenosylcobinamide-phosphate guanylyltransferase [Desulfurella sp.]HEX13437.1 bifunctional adenosylcobinamide kinase/adenosylcobinamide-phosphate guanylyltransferase [Desulfurella acetivorans]